MLCTVRSVGTAVGLSRGCSLYVFLNNPSLRDSRTVPRFSRDGHRGVFLFFF